MVTCVVALSISKELGDISVDRGLTVVSFGSPLSSRYEDLRFSFDHHQPPSDTYRKCRHVLLTRRVLV